MGNLLDYVRWRGDLRFEHAKFCEVDNLVLSALSYIDFQGIVTGEDRTERWFEEDCITMKEAAKIYFRDHDVEEETPGLLLSNAFVQLFYLMSRSERYSQLKLSHYINHVDEIEEKQFSAITIQLGDKTCFVAFRGTDDTVVGWKEDFNMCLQTPVPAQKEAVQYLKWVCKSVRGKLRLGGHSKGGNLAVYAAAFSGARIRKRVLEIYNNDGPGFDKRILESEEYKQIQDKIYAYVPQASMIGMLFEHEEGYQIVYSQHKGVFQHDPFTWEIEGPSFVFADELSQGAQILDQTVKDWIFTIDEEQKAVFVESLFQILKNEEVTTLSELSFKKVTAMLKSLNGMDEQTKKILFSTIKTLIGTAKKNVEKEWKQTKIAIK